MVLTFFMIIMERFADSHCLYRLHHHPHDDLLLLFLLTSPPTPIFFFIQKQFNFILPCLNLTKINLNTHFIIFNN